MKADVNQATKVIKPAQQLPIKEALHTGMPLLCKGLRKLTQLQPTSRASSPIALLKTIPTLVQAPTTARAVIRTTYRPHLSASQCFRLHPLLDLKREKRL